MSKFIYLIFFTFCFCSCKTQKVETFIPPPIVEAQPSWDGERQDSGLIDYIDGKGFLITRGAAERYTFLTEKFGSTLTPPIKAGEGLQADKENFILSPEYMSVFMEVSRLNKQ